VGRGQGVVGGGGGWRWMTLVVLPAASNPVHLSVLLSVPPGAPTHPTCQYWCYLCHLPHVPLCPMYAAYTRMYVLHC
jgi:hypothetical protein